VIRHRLVVTTCAAISLFALPGCTAMQELAALRTLTFAFASVSDVKLAGIPLDASSSYSRLSVADVARLGTAMATKQLPIELVAHVDATNPSENKVGARLVEMDWTLFIEDRRTLAGSLGNPVVIAPGHRADIPLAVRFDLLEFTSGGARDLFDLALAIAGQGSVQKELRFELVPSVETSIGPIRFPAPVVIRR